MQSTRKASLWRVMAGIVTGALFSSAAVVGTALPAQAAAGDVTSGSLAWNVNSSWNTYILNPVWGGTQAIDPVAPSTTLYKYPGATGSVTSSTVADVSTTGGTHWVLSAHGIDETLQNFRVVVDGTHADIYADISYVFTASFNGIVASTDSPATGETDGVLFATSDSASITVADGSATISVPGSSIYGTAAGVTAGFMYGPGGVNNNAFGADLTLTTTVEAEAEAVAPATTTTTLAATPAGTATEGSEVTLTATVSPAADGSVTFFDGTTTLDTVDVAAGAASISTSTLVTGNHSLTAEFTPSDVAAYAGSTSAAVPYTVTAVETPPVVTPTPSLTVTPSTGLDADGATITVTGEIFDTSATGIYGPSAGSAAGFYVEIGYLSDVWQPSAGAASSTRTNAYAAWVQGSSSASPYVLWTLNDDGTADFTWTVTVDQATLEALANSSTGTLSVFTIGAGGVTQAVNEVSTPISFAETDVADTTTTLSVSPASTTTAGSDVTLTAAISPAAVGAVEFFDGTTSLGTADVESGTASLTTAALAEGDHSLTATFTPDDVTAYSGSTSDAVTYTVTAETGSIDVTGATLDWGVKESFRNYIVGFAEGAITTDGVGTQSDGAFLWSNGVGSYDQDSGTGSIDWAGSVNFSGHEGALDLTIDNPSIVITSPTTATLYADVSSAGYGSSPAVDATDVPVATLTLPNGVVSGDGASITWTDAAATLTSEGAAAFMGFYAAGQALDPATFTIPLEDAGLTPVVSLSSTQVTPGQALTITGTGFDAGELIAATVHSDPVSLPAQTAYADGTVVFTWVVPADFEAGSHSIVLTRADGTEITAAYFTVAAADTSGEVTSGTNTSETTAAAAEVCVANSVSGATIDWGFKQSFVDYINGPIASGSISGAWGTGSGAYSVDTHSGSVTYNGSVHYYGHSGILDITLSNLRIQVTGATSAVLYVTTASTGEIALANLTLPTASSTSSSISWSNASATITSSGAQLFSYNGSVFYPAGTTLDSVSFSFPLGAEVTCDSTTDGTLAVTGGSDANGALWIGLTMLVVGVGAVALRRRRVASA